MSHEFLTAWSTFDVTEAPFVLPGDEIVISHLNSSGWTKHTTLAQHVESQQFGIVNDRSLHLGLCPLPFIGNPSKARVFILLLNPGHSPGNFFAEEQPEYRAAVRENLKGVSDFLFLDPKYAWHPGFEYWYRKFHSVIQTLASLNGIGHREAIKRAAENICAIEMVPYHSTAFNLSDRVVCKMRSPTLAKDFVRESLVLRARRGEILLIVTRQVARWGVPNDCHAILYKGHETRSAHLTVESKEKILSFLVAANG